MSTRFLSLTVQQHGSATRRVVARLVVGLLTIAGTWLFSFDVALAEDAEAARGPYAPLPVFDALSTEQWHRVDESVNRGLAWLASQQQPDGSFPTFIGGQPAITAFATMAFLSRGHRPGAGPYGKLLERAIDYALDNQRSTDALFIVDSTDYAVTDWNHGGHTGLYNHAITGMMLTEVYGMTDAKREERIRKAIIPALALARKMQRRPSPYPLDKYGWRYYKLMNSPPGGGVGEADLSVTGWFVMFYRSARNAEFDVPEQYLEDALRFVRTCYDKPSGGFVYGPYHVDHVVGRGMTGAGLLCMTVGGQRDDAIALTAGQWILNHPINQYNNPEGSRDRFHYGAYYCSQAMFVLGGEYWRQFYPTMANTLISNQKPSGNWHLAIGNETVFGETYTTALAILSLTPPYQLLPIYQR